MTLGVFVAATQAPGSSSPGNPAFTFLIVWPKWAVWCVWLCSRAGFVEAAAGEAGRERRNVEWTGFLVTRSGLLGSLDGDFARFMLSGLDE